MKTQELVQIEFRYFDYPEGEDGPNYLSRKIAVGVFNTIEQAVKAGNEVVDALRVEFDFKPEHRFSERGFFGMPDRLVFNSRLRGSVQIYATITKLDYCDVASVVELVKNADARYQKYKGL